jgi:hypothetical protein
MPTNHPINSAKIKRLLEDADIYALVDILRDPAEPDLRAQAAAALGELHEVDATESLVRSHLEDPDNQVKSSARQALEQLLGSQVQVVIDSYRSGPPYPDAWLIEPGEEDEDEDEEEDFSPKISRLLDDRDLNALVTLLRNASRPDLRAEAAAALGELHNADATESLVRSHLEDPDETVQSAAFEALEELVGSQINMVIGSYRSGPAYPDPWLIEPGEDEEEDDEEEENDEVEVGEGYPEDGDLNLDGLMRVALHEPDLAMRQKAIRLLATSRDVRATDALAYLALRDKHKSVQSAARAALKERYGDQAEEILSNYQESFNPSPDEDEDEISEEELEEDEEFEEDEELSVEKEAGPSQEQEEEEEEAQHHGFDRIPRPADSEYPKVADRPYDNGGVIDEARFPWQTVLAVGLLIIVIIVAVLLLTGQL